MSKTRNEFPEQVTCSVFSYSYLDSAWSNYKNLPIFIQGQKKFEFVLQCK